MSSDDTYDVVSTMNLSGYRKYGGEMIRSFLQNWPDRARLVVYAEDFEPVERSPRLSVVDLHNACPGLVAFKAANQAPWQNGLTGKRLSTSRGSVKRGNYNYKFDAVKFANKVYAYCDAARHTKSHYMIWLDADTVTLTRIPEDLIASLGDAFLVYLGRRHIHSECGFIRFDMRHPYKSEFFQTMQAMYQTGEIFSLNEWHDSYVFDVVRSVLSASGKISALSISPDNGFDHPFIHSVLGSYMDHLKGDRRKELGHSTLRDRGLESSTYRWLRKLGLSKEL